MRERERERERESNDNNYLTQPYIKEICEFMKQKRDKKGNGTKHKIVESSNIANS